MHFAEQYLGRPWMSGKSGPDAYDCYGLVRAVYKSVYGVSLPEVNVNAHSMPACVHACIDQQQQWREIAYPIDGCVVTMTRSNLPHHVGIWLDADGGGALHALDGAGVIFSSLPALAALRFKILSYYQYQYHGR